MQGYRPLTLHHGDLRFTAWSGGEGPCVLLLHGFPDLPQTWRELMPALVSAGYRAVAVTARGYEPSSQPQDGDYQLTSLAADVPAWMDSLDIHAAHLVGHDWGSAVASAAAAATPERIHSLCLVSVPHSGRFARVAPKSLRQLWLSRYILLFQLHGAAERKLQADNSVYVETLWQRWSPGWSLPGELTNAVRERFAETGVIEAALAYYRQGADTRTPAGKASRALAASSIQVPTLALHGDRDGCIAPKVFRRSMRTEDFPAGFRVETLANCGHFPQLEQPWDFNRRVLDWLAECSAGVSAA